MAGLGAGLQFGGDAEVQPLLGRRLAQQERGRPLRPLFTFNSGFTFLVVVEVAVLGYASYNNWGLNKEYAALWLVTLIPHLNIVGVGTRRSQPGSRSSALVSGAAHAGIMISLPRLAFAAAMTTALENRDPMKFAHSGFIDQLSEVVNHPPTLSWGAIALCVLAQFVHMIVGSPRSTVRSRFPFSEISALNCLWCLGATLTLISCYLWLLTAIDHLPTGLDSLRVVVATVAGVWAIFITTMQLSSTLRSPCLVIFADFGSIMTSIAVLVLTSLAWQSWLPMGDPQSLTEAAVLLATLPMTMGFLGLFMASIGVHCCTSTIRLHRERARHVRNHFGTPAFRHRSWAVNGSENRRVLPLPRAVRQPGEEGTDMPPPRYGDTMNQRTTLIEEDDSTELIEAAELIAAEGLPPSYMEAVADEHEPTYPPATPRT